MAFRVRITKTMQLDVVVDANSAENAEDMVWNHISIHPEWENSDLDWEIVSVEKV